jgi:hypothetical protein
MTAVNDNGPVGSNLNARDHLAVIAEHSQPVGFDTARRLLEPGINDATMEAVNAARRAAFEAGFAVWLNVRAGCARERAESERAMTETANTQRLALGTPVRYLGETRKIAPAGRPGVNSREVHTGDVGVVEWSAFQYTEHAYVVFGDDPFPPAGMVPVADLEVIADA